MAMDISRRSFLKGAAASAAALAATAIPGAAVLADRGLLAVDGFRQPAFRRGFCDDLIQSHICHPAWDEQ